MNSTNIYNQEYEVLTAEQFETFKSSTDATRTKIPSSAQLRAALSARLEQDYDANKRFKRRLESIFVSGILTLGIGLGLSYSAHASTPMDTISGNAKLQSINTASTIAISTSTASLPAQIQSLKFSTGFNGSHPPVIKSPQWVPAPFIHGNITQSGDIALVNAVKSTTDVKIRVTVANQKTLMRSYQSFDFPIDIYRCNPAHGECGSQSNHWRLVKAPTMSGAYFVSNTLSTFSTSVTPGYFYDLTMNAGQGAFQTNSLKSSTSNSLSPKFSVTSSTQ